MGIGVTSWSARLSLCAAVSLAAAAPSHAADVETVARIVCDGLKAISGSASKPVATTAMLGLEAALWGVQAQVANYQTQLAGAERRVQSLEAQRNELTAEMAQRGGSAGVGDVHIRRAADESKAAIRAQYEPQLTALRTAHNAAAQQAAAARGELSAARAALAAEQGKPWLVRDSGVIASLQAQIEQITQRVASAMADEHSRLAELNDKQAELTRSLADEDARTAAKIADNAARWTRMQTRLTQFETEIAAKREEIRSLLKIVTKGQLAIPEAQACLSAAWSQLAQRPDGEPAASPAAPAPSAGADPPRPPARPPRDPSSRGAGAATSGEQTRVPLPGGDDFAGGFGPSAASGNAGQAGAGQPQGAYGAPVVPTGTAQGQAPGGYGGFGYGHPPVGGGIQRPDYRNLMPGAGGMGGGGGSGSASHCHTGPDGRRHCGSN
ncbi:MAG TPA: hypothetical protein VM491_21970 [Burkholderiaceae bacterium]|nr:hypothetical protein [Burkholderiaceae bacterium]